MKTFNCVQGSDEWFELHRGIPTASNFDRIMTPKKMEMSSQVDKFIAELIGQKLGSAPMTPTNYISRPMLDGIVLEPQARKWYQFHRDTDVSQIGFCMTEDGRFGCSPDALVGDPGALELKCPTPATQVQYLLDAELPTEYAPQVHGELIVTGREWVDFVSYCPLEGGPAALIVRVYPSEYTKRLRECLEVFWERYMKAIEKIKGLGAALEIAPKVAATFIDEPETGKPGIDLAAHLGNKWLDQPAPIEDTAKKNKKTAKKNAVANNDAIDAASAGLPDYLKK